MQTHGLDNDMMKRTIKAVNNSPTFIQSICYKVSGTLLREIDSGSNLKTSLSSQINNFFLICDGIIQNAEVISNRLSEFYYT